MVSEPRSEAAQYEITMAKNNKKLGTLIIQQQSEYPPQQWVMPPPQAPQLAPSQSQATQFWPQQQQQYGAPPLSGTDEVRTLWIGDLQYWMDENYLNTCFYQTGELLSAKVSRNKQTGQSEGYGFLEFRTRATAENILQTYNGTTMPNAEQTYRLKWATLGAGERRTDNSPEHTIFVGGLADDDTDYILQETFKNVYSSVKSAKVVIDRISGRSKGYGGSGGYGSGNLYPSGGGGYGEYGGDARGMGDMYAGSSLDYGEKKGNFGFENGYSQEDSLDVKRKYGGEVQFAFCRGEDNSSVVRNHGYANGVRGADGYGSSGQTPTSHDFWGYEYGPYQDFSGQFPGSHATRQQLVNPRPSYYGSPNPSEIVRPINGAQGFKGQQPPLPTSPPPPPPIPTEIPGVRFVESVVSSSAPRPSSLFPIAVSSGTSKQLQYTVGSEGKSLDNCVDCDNEDCSFGDSGSEVSFTVVLDSDDRPSYMYQPPLREDGYQAKRQKPTSNLPPGWLDCPAFRDEVMGCLIPSEVPLGESSNDYILPGKRYSYRLTKGVEETERLATMKEQTVGYLSEVSNKGQGAELKSFLEVEVGTDSRPISSPIKAKDNMLPPMEEDGDEASSIKDGNELIEASENKIMHRDIKGANILVDNKACIKLADFRASKKVEALATVMGAKSMKATPYWVAPGVVQSDHSYSADIWSVGCTVIEVATGKAPWSQQYQEVAALFYGGTAKFHPPIPEHLSAEAKDFLLKCLQREPDLRRTASDLLKHPFVPGECREQPLGHLSLVRNSSGKRMADLGVENKKENELGLVRMVFDPGGRFTDFSPINFPSYKFEGMQA